MSKTKAIREVLGAKTDDKTVRAQAILDILSSAQSQDEKAELFSIALLEITSAPKNKKVMKNAGLTDDEWDDLAKSHGDMVEGYLKMAFFKTSTAQDFSFEILRLVDFLSKPDEKTFVIAMALYSPYIPYHTLPGTPIHMTSADFKHKLKSEEKRLELIEYICGLPFDEWTEQASLLFQVITDAQDRESQVVLLAAALQRMVKREVNKVVEDLQGNE
jgi:hypothetical protein